MRLLAFAFFSFVLIAGCGKPAIKEPIALDKVPEIVMKTAKEKLPGITFNRAVIKPNGEYELFGKDAKGKIREIDITPAGVVTEVE
jgi:hypothetical protein